LREFKHILVVGEASSYSEMMGNIDALRPDAVLFDLHMPGENLLTLREKLPGVKCALVCMSIWTDDESAKFARELGCRVIDKADLVDQLVPAIEAAVQRHAGK
jgi:DNA-binding NarL/FixJ family response regulator